MTQVTTKRPVAAVSEGPRLRYILVASKEKVTDKRCEMGMKPSHDLEHSMKYLLLFGKLIGLYPTANMWFIRIIPIILGTITIVDWVGMFLEPASNATYRTAAEICGKIGSPQFYTVGTFCYIYIQNYHQKLVKFYEKWKSMLVIKEDKRLRIFINVVSGAVFTSAILENISFHFKLFPVFEPPDGNLTSFEVYYSRSHGFWAKNIPFTPYHATLLLITNKLALYAWNFSDILATVLCRALRHQFDTLNDNIEILGPAYTVKRQKDLTELMQMLENYLSPLVFACFYLDFYATCMQLHMWMTPSEHQHILHTIYLLWAFIHLMVRVFLLSYQASSLHDASVKTQILLRNTATESCPPKVMKEVSRIDYSPKRQLAISGLGCFFITKRFLLTLIYVAFSFQIFLMQSDTLKCP